MNQPAESNERAPAGAGAEAPPPPASGEKSGEKAGEKSGEKRSLERTVGRLARCIAPAKSGEGGGGRHLTNGERAELRRMRPGDPPPPVFWLLVTEHLEPHLPPGDGESRDEAERRWMVILRAMAESAGRHDRGSSLGRALARGRVAERRLYQLLRARGDALVDQLRMVLHPLSSQGLAFDHTDVAWLVLSEGTEGGEEVRRNVARKYFQARRKLQQDQSETRSQP